MTEGFTSIVKPFGGILGWGTFQKQGGPNENEENKGTPKGPPTKDGLHPPLQATLKMSSAGSLYKRGQALQIQNLLFMDSCFTNCEDFDD